MALRSLFRVACVTLAAQRVAADCVSFGVDFQDGNTYFQNSLSTDPFTFVSQYEGCANVTAYNILVDPNGDQYLCSDTNLQPDDTDQLSTCPQDKDQLFSGDWSVVILSNNGPDDDSIAYQRDFSLNVGPQVTTTTTPTVTFSTTTVPLTSTTSTTTFTSTVVAATPTTTVPSLTVTRTYTVIPARVTTTTTSTLYTTTKIKAKVSIVKTTQYVTPTCHLPVVATTADKKCNIKITVAGVSTSAATGSAKKAKLRFARDGNEDSLLDKETFLKERREFLEAQHALEKRAPDVETVTITDTNTSDYPTTTLIVTQPAITATFVETDTTTTTSTPATVTIVKGKTTAPAVTTTLPTPTRTVKRYTIISTTISTTYSPTVTITKKTTPASLKASCRTAGGLLY